MIAANEAVGAFLEERGVDTVWRIHAPPEPGRLEELAEVLASFGVRVDVEDATTPLGMRRVLEHIGDRPAARALSFLVLRSLKQAAYDVVNVGHFGLASKTYLHFTSPIRRYPDILVHRQLKAQLRREGQAGGGGGGEPPSRERLNELATIISSHERRAMEVEREAVAMYRAYLMRDHVGEQFPGRVSAVTSFGLFVEIDQPFVEGLIKYAQLGDDQFEFDPVRMRVTGRKSGFSIGLGDSVHVEVIDASVTRRQVDFRLVGAEERGFDVTPVAAGRRRRGSKRGDARDRLSGAAAEHDRLVEPRRQRYGGKRGASGRPQRAGKRGREIDTTGDGGGKGPRGGNSGGGKHPRSKRGRPPRRR
jgi:ribonuclease R